MKKKIFVLFFIIFIIFIISISYIIGINYYSYINNRASTQEEKLKKVASKVEDNEKNEIIIENYMEEKLNLDDIVVKEDIITNEINEEKQEIIEEKENNEIPKQIETKLQNSNKKTSDSIINNEKENKKEEKVNTSNKKEDIIKQENTTGIPKQQEKVETQKENKVEIKKDNEIKEEVIIKKEIERCTNNNNHGMDVGNSGKWFSTRQKAIDYYDKEQKKWSDWCKENPDERWGEYLKKCPSGYEIWNCMFCDKWTINFYYR